MAPCLPELPSLARLLVFTFRATGGLAMRKVIVGALAVVTMALLAAPVEAFGHRRRNCDSGCADVCAPAPQMAVTYQERVMTGYRPEYKMRNVNVTVNRVVSRNVEEKYNYTEMVPVTTAEKRTVTH